MASLQQVTMGSSHVAQPGASAATAIRRSSLVVVGALALAVFAALWSTYSTVNAGVDYPEPWGLASR